MTWDYEKTPRDYSVFEFKLQTMQVMFILKKHGEIQIIKKDSKVHKTLDVDYCHLQLKKDRSILLFTTPYVWKMSQILKKMSLILKIISLIFVHVILQGTKLFCEQQIKKTFLLLTRIWTIHRRSSYLRSLVKRSQVVIYFSETFPRSRLTLIVGVWFLFERLGLEILTFLKL